MSSKTVGIIIQEATDKTWISISMDCRTTAGLLAYYSSENLSTCYTIDCAYEKIAFNVWALIDEHLRGTERYGNWYAITSASEIYAKYQSIADGMVMEENDRMARVMENSQTKRSLSLVVPMPSPDSSSSGSSSSSSSESSSSDEQSATPPLKRTKTDFPSDPL